MLSKDIHVDSDEECLEIAENLRKALVFVVDQIIRNREAKLDFKDSLKNLLDKKK